MTAMTTTHRELVVLRHAKSAWPDGVPDERRPLNERGQRDAGAAGRWLREHVGPLGAVVCSPAERTRQTWQLVGAELAGPPAVTVDERIYDATPEALLAVVHDLPDAASRAVLVGHLPGVAELVALLTGKDVPMKTSALAVLTWTGSWADADAQVAQLREHALPRG